MANTPKSTPDSPGTENKRTMTYGEKAVGLTFNPSGDAYVHQMKEQAAKFIDSCNTLRGEATDPEVKRIYSVAITEAQTAQMWAVKAATWKND